MTKNDQTPIRTISLGHDTVHFIYAKLKKNLALKKRNGNSKIIC